MSSPRKYSSPYLSGLPGLPISTSSAVTGTVKTKKKSKTSLVKLSESAQVVKQIQDGIWQNAAAKPVSSKTSTVAATGTAGSGLWDYQGTSSPFPRRKESNSNFNDASCGDIPDFQKMGINEEEIRGNELEVEGEENMKSSGDGMPRWEESEYKDGDGAGGATALITCKDSILLKQGSSLVSSRSTTEVYHEDWGIPPEDNEDENENEELEFHSGNRPVHLRSILKKPSVYYTKPIKFELSKKSGGKTVSKGKFGRPNKEVKESPQGMAVSQGAGRGNKLRNAQGSISNLEMHSKLMGNGKGLAKSPRKKSKVNTKVGVEENKWQSGGMEMGPKKAVRFSTRVDVHSVPYEPRAGSRACDWQRNMLEQRVQTFRQLMREVGGADEMDLFGNSMLFPGYPAYNVPNPNFALRGNSIGPPGSSGPPGIIGLQGMGRGRNSNYKL